MGSIILRSVFLVCNAAKLKRDRERELILGLFKWLRTSGSRIIEILGR